MACAMESFQYLTCLVSYLGPLGVLTLNWNGASGANRYSIIQSDGTHDRTVGASVLKESHTK